MSELKIMSIDCYSSFGNVRVETAGQKLSIELNETDRAEFMALGLRCFQRNQAALAEAIASAQPALLMSPEVEDAEYSDIPL